MTEFGPNGEVIREPRDYSAGSYASGERPRRIRRVKLGLFLSSLAACLSVTLLGLAGVFIFTLTGSSNSFYAANASPFAQGVQLGLMMCLYNFILFIITVPAAWIAMGFSIGRFPHRRIAARPPYLRWGAIWGAILVGATTATFGALAAGPLAGLGAALTGILIGTLAGMICGLLFFAIVRPAEQLLDADVSVF